MCSEQTRLSRVAIEGHHGSQQLLHLYSSNCVREGHLVLCYICDTVQVHLITTLTDHWGINFALNKEKHNALCDLRNARMCISIHSAICVVESKAFDPNLCLCIIHSLKPASLCLFFKACIRS